LGDNENGKANIIQLLKFPDNNSFNQLFSQLNYSSEFSSLIYPSIFISANNLNITKEEMETYCMQDIRSCNNLTIYNELFAKEVFVAIKDSSEDFWNGKIIMGMGEGDTIRKNPNLPDWCTDCAEWSIYMDALGGLVGFGFGGIGSILTAAAFSAGAYRECICDGDYD
jgi:hypothetical protein